MGAVPTELHADHRGVPRQAAGSHQLPTAALRHPLPEGECPVCPLRGAVRSDAWGGDCLQTVCNSFKNPLFGHFLSLFFFPTAEGFAHCCHSWQPFWPCKLGNAEPLPPPRLCTFCCPIGSWLGGTAEHPQGWHPAPSCSHPGLQLLPITLSASSWARRASQTLDFLVGWLGFFWDCSPSQGKGRCASLPRANVSDRWGFGCRSAA